MDTRAKSLMQRITLYNFMREISEPIHSKRYFIVSELIYISFVCAGLMHN